VSGRPRHVYLQGGLSSSPSWGRLFWGSLSGTGRIGHSSFQNSWLLKPNLMVSADCEPTSGSRIRRSSESSTMHSHRSKLNGTVYGMNDWPDCVRGQAALYRNLAEQTDDPVVKHELLALAFVCDEVADNIEDHLTGEKDPAPRRPLSRLS
jgi:hypothetical protein